MFESLRVWGDDPDALSTGRLLATPEDGRLKLYLIWRTLCLRQQQPDLFQHGEYLPLAVEGPKANHVVAFARKSGTTTALIVVPRLIAGLLNDFDIDLPPIGPRVWDDTCVLLPFRSSSEKCRNAFTGEVLDLQQTGESARIGVSKALAEFPVALCILG
jgi:(1->4)-alpha-D-glucan 1-alpha-D-glucosylmutase